MAPPSGETLSAPPTGENPVSPAVTNASVAEDPNLTLLKKLLGHPIISSKEVIVRQYDHEVQGGSVVKPLMGVDGDGPTDACVFRPDLAGWKGVAISNGLNPQMGKWDPYLMAKYAVDEAVRNMIAVGGNLSRAAILDNFCWGDSRDPVELGGLVRAAEGCREAASAYGLPFISGKDSFNNTWKTKEGVLMSIPPTLLISCIGVLDDVRVCLTSALRGDGNFLYVVGETKESLKGSILELILKESSGELADFDLGASKALFTKMKNLIRHRLIASCHDVSEGGIGVAVAEMAFGSPLGVELNLSADVKDNRAFLFSETPSRFIVEVTPEAKNEFEIIIGARGAQFIGRTVKDPSFVLKNGDLVMGKVPIPELKTIWKSALSHL